MVLPSSCFLQTQWTQSNERVRRLAVVGWLAALMVEWEDIDPWRQSVFPEFVGDKECVSFLQTRWGKGEVEESRWGGFTRRDSLSQKREAGGAPWKSRGPGKNHGQSEVVHCPAPQETWISLPSNGLPSKETWKSFPKRIELSTPAKSREFCI